MCTSPLNCFHDLDRRLPVAPVIKDLATLAANFRSIRSDMSTTDRTGVFDLIPVSWAIIVVCCADDRVWSSYFTFHFRNISSVAAQSYGGSQISQYAQSWQMGHISSRLLALLWFVILFTVLLHTPIVIIHNKKKEGSYTLNTTRNRTLYIPVTFSHGYEKYKQPPGPVLIHARLSEH